MASVMANGYPQTEGERLVALETRMCNMEQTLGEVREDLDAMRRELREERNELRRMLQDFLDQSDTRYANKLSERVVFGMAGAVLLAVLYLVLRVVGI